MCDQQWLRPACAYAQSVQSLCKSLEYSMNVQLLTEHHLEFLSLKGAPTQMMFLGELLYLNITQGFPTQKKKTIEGYIDSVPSLTFNTIKT